MKIQLNVLIIAASILLAGLIYDDMRHRFLLAKRKYRHTLEAVRVAHGYWAGVNTGRTNALVAEALSAGRIDGLSPADGVEREVTFAESRFDLALGERAAPHTFIEVKNVTLGPAPGEADSGEIRFPDSVTERGQKHLRTLMAAAREGFADDGTISVLTISALMPTPEQAQAVASEFATRTIELSQTSRIEQARETLTFFVEKETALISEVAELENEITAYRNANNVALPGGIEMRREEISTLNTGLLEIEREQIELRRQADQTTSNQRQATAQRMLEVFEEKLATLDAQRDLLLNRRSALERSLETTPEVERQLGVYERRMGQLQTELELISQRRTEAEVGFRLEASRQSERLTVIESAPLPDYPATGGRKKKALMGGVASFGLALGIAFLLELRRPVLRSVAQMERETGLTPVVAIPYLDTSSKRRGFFARLRMALGGRRRTGTEPSG